MFDVLSDMNWLAIILASLAYFVLGAIWFTPLFGKAYDKAIGHTRAKNQKWPLIYYIGPLIGCIAVTIATSVLIYALNIGQLTDALVLGLIVGVGYAMSISFTNSINPKTPNPALYGAVTGGYHVVGIVLVAAILCVMK